MLESDKEKEIIFVDGKNGSFAQNLGNGQWVVLGAKNVLGELEPEEFGYLMNGLTPNTLHKLPNEAPVYAGASNFKDELENSYPITEDYTSKSALLELTNEIIRHVQDYVGTNNKYLKSMTLQRQEKLACVMLNQLTWQTPESYAIEFEDDIEWCFESKEFGAYPMLFAKGAKKGE